MKNKDLRCFCAERGKSGQQLCGLCTKEDESLEKTNVIFVFFRPARKNRIS